MVACFFVFNNKKVLILPMDKEYCYIRSERSIISRRKFIMKDEVQAPQEKTPNTYWRWLVESWRYPLGHNLGEK